MTIGILDGHTVQSLIFSKQLTNNGHKVILVCNEKISYGYFTKYASKKILSPFSSKNQSKYHQFVIDLLKINKIDVLVPMNDDSAKYLSKYKYDLLVHVRILIPDFDVFMNAYDKNKLMKICSQNGYPHPKTINLENEISESEKLNFTFPALIKPNETTGSRGFRIVKNFEEVQKVYYEIKENFGNCSLQEFIPAGGRQFKVQILICNNKLVHSSVIEKLRFYPLKGGSSCFNKTISNKKMVDLCLSVLNTIKWNGFADFDLIEDPRDGSVLIIEINPRVPACIKAAVISGIDFPNAIVDQSLGIHPKSYKYSPGKYLRFLGIDILWIIKSKKSFLNLKLWIKKLISKNHFFQDLEISDPLPFIFGTIGGFLKQINPNFNKRKKGMI